MRRFPATRGGGGSRPTTATAAASAVRTTSRCTGGRLFHDGRIRPVDLGKAIRRHFLFLGRRIFGGHDIGMKAHGQSLVHALDFLGIGWPCHRTRYPQYPPRIRAAPIGRRSATTTCHEKSACDFAPSITSEQNMDMIHRWTPQGVCIGVQHGLLCT
jgi:hypothetical protein